MTNPNYPNLTNAGKGRPRLGNTRLTISIKPHLALTLKNHAIEQRLTQSQAIETLIKLILKGVV